MEEIKKTVNLFKVFSDTTRLRIIELLSKGEYCVDDISKTLEISQSAISHQLRTLREKNIVKTRKSGKQIFYSLKDEHIKEIFLVGYSHANECN